MESNTHLLINDSSAYNDERKVRNDLLKSRHLSDKPKRSILQLFKMGSVYFGIEMLFSIEMALTVPILLKLKVSERYKFIKIQRFFHF
jgi:hypothetical protein